LALALAEQRVRAAGRSHETTRGTAARMELFRIMHEHRCRAARVGAAAERDL
jgi:hypothetical protein